MTNRVLVIGYLKEINNNILTVEVINDLEKINIRIDISKMIQKELIDDSLKESLFGVRGYLGKDNIVIADKITYLTRG